MSENKDDQNPYLNNPLHGVGLKTMLEELVTHYGFDILYAYLNINCFKANPSVAASAKFLKKTDWAREKVEIFYLYQYKNLPKVSSEQYSLPARERIVPENQKPRDPAVLSIEDGERLQEKRAKNVASRNSYEAGNKGSSRKYNEQRKERSGSSYGKSKSQLRDDARSGSRSDSRENYPSPPKDPWGNFKKK